ncbi:uncharacterized protein TRAVEDRAFT_26273 [Trametes versicolor FP-101664 SS1]|uniref:uncharacterized protein n=1 Tax=Trametes versicolor (strain FP-101664) TaxID=717944 RepID=UPI00046236E3|nr:uncharacterized protein TRAVEDRAFT_26273 [Trametes versicolor FP-101664 SS1]EIW62593.1 hypothetical protein TRAVEDRAFT_26273 [Trametes versicolor FP-101664 SS1]
MSTVALPPTPKSPSVGARRKGPKQLPKLPLSAFTPPNTGTSEQFPLAPSPNSLQPETVVDGHVIAPDGSLTKWKEQTGQALGGRIRGVVLSLHGAPEEVEKVVQDIQSSASSSTTPILAIAVPFVLENGVPTSPPSYLTADASAKPTIVLSTTFKESTPAAIEALAWALTQGFTVNIDIQSDLQQESGWESLEVLLTKATESQDAKGKIVLSNILPPPDSLALPIVKLLTHQLYRSYQAHIASLSLFSNLFVSFLPPAWGAPTPHTPAPTGVDVDSEESREKAARLESQEAGEWKRRIKMYIGPTVEAFGFSRIFFGSSPSAPLTATTPASRAGDWFELARESFAELGVEQDAIDAVFAENAKQVYGGSS